MKHILSLFLLTITVSANAVSTCETRVDSHQKANTKQRVEYCLTDEPISAAPAGPTLVYTGTYSVEPASQKSIKSAVKNGHFRDDKMAVQHQYVGSRNFPKFTNDTLSEQERAELAEAYLRELDQQHQAAQAETVKKVMTERAPARLDNNVQATRPQEISVANLLKAEPKEQSTQGVKKRQQKPKRFMKSVPTQQETVVSQPEQQQSVEPAPQTAPAVESAPSSDPLFSAAYGDDDFLNDELGLEEEPAAAPIPASADKK